MNEYIYTVHYIIYFRLVFALHFGLKPEVPLSVFILFFIARPNMGILPNTILLVSVKFNQSYHSVKIKTEELP